MMRHRVAWCGAASVALSLALPACEPSDTEPQATLRTVDVARVEVADVVDRIEASGELMAVDEALIAAEVEGRVTELLRDEGDTVAEGEVILRIDPERRELENATAKAGLAEARAAQREASRDQKRVEQLHDRGAASDAQLDAAKTALEQAVSRVRASSARLGVAERALRDAEVKAPFSGLVARKHVSRGEFVRPGVPLVELVAIDPVEVEFRLAERDSERVRKGQDVDVRVAPMPDEVFRARVTMVAPTIDPATRTLRVKAELASAGGRLRPGLFARVDLGVAQRSGVILVPETAVLQRASGPIVYVVGDEDRVARRSVETGTHRGSRVEVAVGLAPGERVVVRGNARLVDGSVVRVRTAKTPAVAQGEAQAP